MWEQYSKTVKGFTVATPTLCGGDLGQYQRVEAGTRRMWLARVVGPSLHDPCDILRHNARVELIVGHGSLMAKLKRSGPNVQSNTHQSGKLAQRLLCTCRGERVVPSRRMRESRIGRITREYRVFHPQHMASRICRGREAPVHIAVQPGRHLL
jgi:hypothetical protein